MLLIVLARARLPLPRCVTEVLSTTMPPALVIAPLFLVEPTNKLTPTVLARAFLTLLLLPPIVMLTILLSAGLTASTSVPTVKLILLLVPADNVTLVGEELIVLLALLPVVPVKISIPPTATVFPKHARPVAQASSPTPIVLAHLSPFVEMGLLKVVNSVTPLTPLLILNVV
jgi:hypothetical protein